MATTRVFVCQKVNDELPREGLVLDQLRTRLQEVGAEVVMYVGSPDDDGFIAFLHQQLSICQWFVLYQTPAIVQSAQVRMAVSTALKLVEQKHMQGLVRLSVTPSDPQELPPEWASIPNFDATYDYPRALEKLLLTLSVNHPTLGSSLIAPPPAARLSPVVPLPSYDRPPEDASRLNPLKKAFRNASGPYRRQTVIICILLLIVILASVLGTMLLTHKTAAKPQPHPGLQIYGHLNFFSSGFTGTQDVTGIADGVDISLKGLKVPAAGDSYYAWLLPDKSSEMGITRSLGSFLAKKGSAYLEYVSPTHDNLLSLDSRFLLTEERISPAADSPSADKSTWRYYAELPQIPNPKDSSHYSALDHLRHLLASDPMMSMGANDLKGGLGIWFFQNIRKILEWSAAARGTGVPTSPDLMHRHFVRILDALDGADFVHLDVPAGTPVLADMNIARKPLLTLDPAMMELGYIHEIETHLLGLTDSPLVADAQQKLAGRIGQQLNAIKSELEQIRADAKQLVMMTSKQLVGQAALPLLEDMVSQATMAFAGKVDPTTGTRAGGATWIFDHMLQLAQMQVTSYPPPTQKS